MSWPPVNLRAIARAAMQDRGFGVDFSPEALRECERLSAPAVTGLRDTTGWLWSSIDNDESLDLDQLEYAEPEPGGIRVYVAIANVDWAVPRGSALDAFAQRNTTSVYTGVETFHMLPDRLSTDLTSLREGEKRLAIVVEMQVTTEGQLTSTSIYPACVQNKAKLTYDAVGRWLEGKAGLVNASAMTRQTWAKIQADPALQRQLKLQDQAAQALRALRQEAGALTLEAIEFYPGISPQGEMILGARQSNRASQLIEDFMIAANRSVVEYLQGKGLPTFRRVVRTPKRWDRIIELAGGYGFALPLQPDVQRLEEFLKRRRKEDPERFPDLSLTVIKLLGRGEYVVNYPGQAPVGHFSLAVENYTHSTAPNRRYPDLITQRLLLAAFSAQTVPYLPSEMDRLAAHCTEKEDDANKVERTVRKSLAALAMSHRIGEEFQGFITGASDKGVWVRLLQPPIEGKVLGSPRRLDVGDRVWVQLVATDARRGYIDFEVVKRI